MRVSVHPRARRMAANFAHFSDTRSPSPTPAASRRPCRQPTTIIDISSDFAAISIRVISSAPRRRQASRAKVQTNAQAAPGSQSGDGTRVARHSGSYQRARRPLRPRSYPQVRCQGGRSQRRATALARAFSNSAPTRLRCPCQPFGMGPARAAAHDFGRPASARRGHDAVRAWRRTLLLPSGPYPLSLVANVASGAAVQADWLVEGVAPLQTARPGEVSFLENRRYATALEETSAGR